MTAISKAILMIITSYLCLPWLMNDQPILVYHQQSLYFPIITTYLESDLGGEHPIVIDFNDPYTNTLLEDAFILHPPYPWGLNPDLNETHHLSKPSATHWLGTNHLGQDILAYSLHALIISLMLPAALTTISAGIGGGMGMISAAFGGWADIGYQWIYEVCRSVPFALIIMLTQHHPLWVFLLIFTTTQWTRFAQLSRNETYQLLEKPFIQDAIFAGLSKWKLTQLHLFPHVLQFWKNQLPYTFLNYLVLQQSLNYFGLDLFPQSPSLGGLLIQAKQHPDSLWMLLAVLLCFASTAFITLRLCRKNQIS